MSNFNQCRYRGLNHVEIGGRTKIDELFLGQI